MKIELMNASAAALQVNFSSISRLFFLPVLILFGLLTGAVSAQEGHPLSGSWSGEWRPSQGGPEHIRLYMTWNDTAIEGIINPGRSGVTMTVAKLNTADWTVRFEGDNTLGEHIVIEGTLDEIGSYNRTIEGMWWQGGRRGGFKLTRD